MGTYVTFETKTTEAEQVNALFTFQYKEKLTDISTSVVNSVSTILQDIAYMKVDPQQSRLADVINCIEDWNSFLPAYANGLGQVKISGNLTSDEKYILEFVNNNQSLFSEINDETGGEYINRFFS